MLLEQQIISAYFYQAGQLQVALRQDKMLNEAERIINDNDTYLRLLKSEKMNTK
jgi:carboxyl-terminal processing protease